MKYELHAYRLAGFNESLPVSIIIDVRFYLEFGHILLGTFTCPRSYGHIVFLFQQKLQEEAALGKWDNPTILNVMNWTSPTVGVASMTYGEAAFQEMGDLQWLLQAKGYFSRWNEMARGAERESLVAGS